MIMLSLDLVSCSSLCQNALYLQLVENTRQESTTEMIFTTQGSTINFQAPGHT